MRYFSVSKHSHLHVNLAPRRFSDNMYLRQKPQLKATGPDKFKEQTPEEKSVK